MAEDPGKQEEKLEFTPEGEALGYISLDQARVLAMRTAAETPGTYGSSFANKPMAFEVVEAEETEDHYVITLGFRPQGEYAGRPGREQFFIQKEGGVAHRQVLALPRPRRGFPVIPVGIALAVLGVVAIILVLVIPNIGGDNGEPPSVAVMPTDTPEPDTVTSSAGETELPLPTEAVLPGSPNTQPTSATSPAPAPGTGDGTSILQPLDADAGLVNIPVSHQGILEINANQSVAQSFTVPSDGVVTGAEIIGLSRSRCAAAEGLEIRLLATDQGLPGSLVFHSENLSPSAISEKPGNIAFDLGANGWTVGQYESLALELSSAAGPGGCSYTWDGDSSGTYTGGQAFTRPSETETWQPDSRDMGFRVYFQPEGGAAATGPTPVPVTPTPTATPVAIVITATPKPTLRPASTPKPTPTSESTPVPTLSATPVAISTNTLGKIAFVSERDGNLEIYTINADGSNQTRLTFNDAVDSYPDWSPDGAQVVFVSDRDGNSEIYTMNADGSNQIRLTFNDAFDTAPTWSPEESPRIAFTSDRDGNGEIYTMDEDGKGQTRLTFNDSLDSSPAWSPDGTRIAFGSERDGTVEIYFMNADGTSQSRLTFNDAIDWYPAWSPDGTRIAFESYRDGPRAEIYTMNPDGSDQIRLTFDVDIDFYGAAWSPDGTRIAFPSSLAGNGEIYSINADGSGLTRLTFVGALARWPTWSR